MLKLRRLGVGWYVTPDGKWGVIGDGADSYVSQAEADGDGVGAGLNTSAEWAIVRGPGLDNTNDGETLTWTSTLREGRELLEKLIEREGGEV